MTTRLGGLKTEKEIAQKGNFKWEMGKLERWKRLTKKKREEAV